jgi:carbamoyl-phosphate synthase small subunit
VWFANADDDTVEGIEHKSKPVIAVQFHPEASPGPYDCMFVFDRFKDIMTNGMRPAKEIQTKPRANRKNPGQKKGGKKVAKR